MTAPQFVAFLERKLVENDVRKVVPDHDILEQHVRRVIERQLADALLSDNHSVLQAKAAAIEIPPNLHD